MKGFASCEALFLLTKAGLNLALGLFFAILDHHILTGR
jgi:hypothetical protein